MLGAKLNQLDFSKKLWVGKTSTYVHILKCSTIYISRNSQRQLMEETFSTEYCIMILIVVLILTKQKLTFWSCNCSSNSQKVQISLYSHWLRHLTKINPSLSFHAFPSSPQAFLCEARWFTTACNLPNSFHSKTHLLYWIVSWLHLENKMINIWMDLLDQNLTSNTGIPLLYQLYVTN